MSSPLDHLGVVEGSIEEGGWRATGNVFGDADRLKWYQEIESWYNLYAGGAWEANPRLSIRGHLIPDLFTKRLQSSIAPWSAFTAQEFMKRGEVQGIFFREAISPANDHQLAVGDTYGDIVQHIVGKSGQFGHTNLALGIWPEGFMATNIDTASSVSPGEHEVREGNFWATLQEIADIDAHLLYVDKTNTLQYIPHPMFTSSPTAVFDIAASLLLEPLDITPRNTETIGQVKIQGTTPSGLQISGYYPTAPCIGPVLHRSGFKASSSALINTIAERIYRFENRDYDVAAMLPGGVGLMVDLMDMVTISYSSAADGVAWAAKKFWVESIRVEVKSNFTATTMLRLTAEN